MVEKFVNGGKMELVDGRRTPWPCVPAEEVIFLSSSTHDLWAIRDSGLCSLHKKRDGFHVGSPTPSPGEN